MTMLTSRMRTVETTDASLMAGDEWRVCADCQQPWLFTATDKAWYASKRRAEDGLPLAEPRRCVECRRFRRGQVGRW